MGPPPPTRAPETPTKAPEVPAVAPETPEPEPSPPDDATPDVGPILIPFDPDPPARWETYCTHRRLVVTGVGMDDQLSATLDLPDPGTIDELRVQVTLKARADTEDAARNAAHIVLSANGRDYFVQAPTSVSQFSRGSTDWNLAYEIEVPPGSVVSATIHPVGSGKIGAESLVAYAWRRTPERWSTVGETVNHSIHYHGDRSFITLPLKLSPSQVDRDVVVRAVVADNNPDDRALYLRATAGEVETELSFASPNRGNNLDIREVILRDVAAGTEELYATLESPQGGDSAILRGVWAEIRCTEAVPTPLPTGTPAATSTPAGTLAPTRVVPRTVEPAPTATPTALPAPVKTGTPAPIQAPAPIVAPTPQTVETVPPMPMPLSLPGITMTVTLTPQGSYGVGSYLPGRGA